MSFGKNLRLARMESGKTQDELAECLAVTRQSVSKWETGEGYPEIEKLIQIVAVLDVSLFLWFSQKDHLVQKCYLNFLSSEGKKKLRKHF